MITKKQRLYAQYRFDGIGKKAAAIKAGYAEGCAASAATKLEKHPKVMAHILRLKTHANSPANDEPQPHYDCPLDFMRALMGDVKEDPRLRLESAKALASFTISKASEKGKKAQRKEEAGKVLGRGRFAPSLAPVKLV